MSRVRTSLPAPNNMLEHSINSLNNFISGWYFEDTSICDELIEFHKNSKFKNPGVIGRTVGSEIKPVVDKSHKDSSDCQLDGDLLSKYFLSLKNIVDAYIEKYPFCNYYSPWKIVDRVNIQHYTKNGGYHAWHTERSASGPSLIASRHLTFITYLNTVQDKGETEFFHQNISVKAEKGLTIIWPVDWTFTHRGIASPTEDKWIATGWFNYV